MIELMIAVAVLAILIGIAAPTIRDVLLNARMTAQVNDLMADLSTARSEAVKRNIQITLCTSGTGTACTGAGGSPARPAWERGWMIFVDTDRDGRWDAGEEILKTSPELQPRNTLVVAGDANAGGSARSVSYHPSGISSGGNIFFTMCDFRRAGSPGITFSARQNKGRRITINATGRPVVSRVTC